ncbi:hypothetical protein ALP91_00828 [Pseudomonas savastanoi pv. glycinea]|nr:hypothetical protein ALP91_00828 [Pseudomonas savastanoi pv. glycinea]
MLQHLLLNIRPLAALLTIQAQYTVQAAVQLDDVLASGLTVQCINVLGDQSADGIFNLQCSQCPMRGIGLRRANTRPAQHRPRPVTLARSGVADKLLIHHRLFATPHAVLVAVVRNAGRGADTCAGDDQKGLAGHCLAKCFELTVGCSVQHLQTSNDSCCPDLCLPD